MSMSALRGSNAAPEYPAAHSTRPQFGSDPAIAVLTSGELAMARANLLRRDIARRALHFDRHQFPSALAVLSDLAGQRFKHLGQRRFEGAFRSFLLSPRRSPARTASVSLVDVSPSTEIRL